ncbi:Uncharacterised protein [Listeria grayi]|uniref:Uncharacterized protein n=1 Tax=Listeria grayi FSL F6-1183 TaxID=1265827 RepID=A0A829R4Z4_LISGR|nr:hypothetical protein [Listeria grayi]EUJ26635.1 hypothetical protein LMUR_12536 [Listeria grayi FSL F6-1183]VEI35947.1 Uncharacterised protein [Listeria grayi]
MELWNQMMALGALPTLNGVTSWVIKIVVQLLMIVVFFLIAKHAVKMKIGGVIGAVILGSAGVFMVQNFTMVQGWVAALLKLL